MRHWQFIVSAFLTASMLYFHGHDYLAMLQALRDISLPPIEQRHSVNTDREPAPVYQWGN